MAHQTRISIMNELTANHSPVATALKANNLATFNPQLGYVELQSHGKKYLAAVATRCNGSSPVMRVNASTVERLCNVAERNGYEPVLIFHSQAVKNGVNKHPRVWGIVPINNLPLHPTLLGGERKFIGQQNGHLYLHTRDVDKLSFDFDGINFFGRKTWKAIDQVV